MPRKSARLDRRFNCNADFWKVVGLGKGLRLLRTGSASSVLLELICLGCLSEAHDLTSAQWEQSNLCYKTGAARGADGFDHHDLRLMLTCFKRRLVSMLNAVECGASWPAQLQDGYGICLLKRLDAAFLGDFRPITLLSMIYRTWFCWRSKLCLAHLSKVKLQTLARKDFFLSENLVRFAQGLAENSLQQGFPWTHHGRSEGL